MNHLSERMEKSVESAKREWSRIRTGAANPSILDGVYVDYYGTPTPIGHISSITIPEPRTLSVSPWEKNMMGAVEKAILASNLGLTPNNDGSSIRLVFPIVTQERRKELVKTVKKIAEDTKVAIRNTRRDENDRLKRQAKEDGISEDQIKGDLDQIQKVTDAFIKKVDELALEKEADLMKV
jgi:ribosome recycling factor